MRDLSSYLHRRKVRTQADRDAWAERNGIDSHIKLMQFCESKQLKCTGTWVFRISAPKERQKPAGTKPAPTTETETWHVPAAERPIGRTTKPASQKAKGVRKTTKTRTAKKKTER